MQRECDNDILGFVRQAAQWAPVTGESVANFLVDTRRRRMTTADVRDRIAYLVSAKLLESEKVWEPGGEVQHFTVTALGMDVCDGLARWPGRS